MLRRFQSMNRIGTSLNGPRGTPLNGVRHKSVDHVVKRPKPVGKPTAKPDSKPVSKRIGRPLPVKRGTRKNVSEKSSEKPAAKPIVTQPTKLVKRPPPVRSRKLAWLTPPSPQSYGSLSPNTEHTNPLFRKVRSPRPSPKGTPMFRRPSKRFIWAEEPNDPRNV